MDLQKLIDKALEVGFEDVEIIASSSKEVEISLNNGQIEKNFAGSGTVFTIRAIINSKMTSFTFENENEDVDYIVNKMKENINVLTTDEEFTIFEGSENYPKLVKEDGKFSEKTSGEKIELLQQIYQTAKQYDSRLVNFPHCSYIEESSKREVINSKGLHLSKEIQYGGAVLVAIALDENGKTTDGSNVAIKLKYDEIDPIEIANKACKEAISMIGAGPIATGNYDVIIENEAMTSLVAGFSSMFSGDAAIKKLTSLVGKENKQIMSEKITIVDDPLRANAISSETFDDDGVATYTKEVVSNGVFKTFLHNLKTAKYFNTKSTGNAIGQGVGGINFYIKEGIVSKEDMIKNLEKGLLITSLAGLHASLNPVSGDFSAQASGFYIENGQIIKPVTLIVVSSNFLKMMNEVDTIGSDLHLSYNGYGAPSILFKGISVSGN